MLPPESRAICCENEAPGVLEIFRVAVTTTCAWGSGVTVREAVFVPFPADEVNVIEAVCATGLEKTVKDALVANWGTIPKRKRPRATVESLLVSEILVPPSGAGTSKVTVPVLWSPPVTLFGLRVTAIKFGGCRVREPA